MQSYYEPYYGETYQKEGVAATLPVKIVVMVLRAGGVLRPNEDPAVDNDFSLFAEDGEYLGRVSSDVLLMSRTHLTAVVSNTGEWRHGIESRQEILFQADTVRKALRDSTSNVGILPFRGEVEAAACITSLVTLIEHMTLDRVAPGDEVPSGPWFVSAEGFLCKAIPKDEGAEATTVWFWRDRTTISIPSEQFAQHYRAF